MILMSSRLNENHIYSTEKLNIKFQKGIIQFNNLGTSTRETIHVIVLQLKKTGNDIYLNITFWWKFK